MTEFFLIAHLVNAKTLEDAEVEVEVASIGIDGEWYTNSGDRVIPFWTHSMILDIPPIPEGWIEHIHELARHYAANHATPTVSLLDALGIQIKPQAQPPIKRRM